MNFLPGWDIPVGALGKSAIQLTKVLSSTGTTSVTLPSGIEAGDLIVIARSSQDSGSDPPNIAVPSGFTEAHELSGVAGGTIGCRATIVYKVADGTEDSTIIDTSSGGNFEVAFSVIFRPSNPIATVSVVDTGGEVTSFNPSAAVLGDATTNVNLVFGSYNVRDTDVASASMSPTEDETLTSTDSTVTGAVKYKLFNPADTSTSVTIDLGDQGGANQLMGVAFKVSQ